MATGPTVRIGDITDNCTVSGTVTNKGDVTFQTDGKTSFDVGNKNKNVWAKDIVNKTKYAQTTNASTSANQIDGRDSQTENCVVCRERSKNTMVRPCNHASFCKECIEIIMNGNNISPTCPVCRGLIAGYEPVFL